MGLTLAAMLGQIGLPGGGFGHGYGSMNEPGLAPHPVRTAAAAARVQPRVVFHPRRGGQRHAAAPRRTLRLQRASSRTTRTSSWCTGPAATRFTTIRTSPACGVRWAGPTPWWCTTRTGPPMAKHADIVVPSTTFARTRRLLRVAQRPRADGDAETDRTVCPIARRLRDVHRPGPRARFRGRIHRRPHGKSVAGSSLPDLVSNTGFRGAVIRRVLACRPIEAAHRGRVDPARRLSRRPGGAPTGHSQRADRDLLTRHRQLRLRRLRGSPGVVRAGRMARRAARGHAIHCICWPTSPRAGCTANWTAARPARSRKSLGENLSG